MTAKAQQRLLFLGMLFLATFAWVGLMSIQFGGAATPLPGSFGFIDDGSVKAQVARLDNQNFEITLSMRVTKSDGQVIGGLSQQDFEVQEDGTAVGIKKFVTAGQQSVRACLVIDCSGSMAGPVSRDFGAVPRMKAAQDASIEFLNLMRDGTDHLGMYYFYNSQIRQALPVGLLDPARRVKVKQEIDGLKPGGGTPLYDAIEQALGGMKGVTGRRILMVLTDGMDDKLEGRQFEQAQEQRNRIIKRAQELNVPLILIGVGDSNEIDQDGMKKLANETKGEYLYTPTAEALKNFYHTLGQTLQNEYALTYDSPNPEHDGLARKVDVGVRCGGSGARATTEYKVAGVLSGGSSAGRKAVSPPLGTAASEERGAPFGSVFFPLLGLLGLLFGVPYALSLRPRAATVASPAAPVLSVAAAKAVAPAPAQPTPAQVPRTLPPRPPGSGAPAPIWKPPAAISSPVPPAPPGSAPAAPPVGEHICPTCRRPAAAAAPGKHYCMICERRF